MKFIDILFVFILSAKSSISFRNFAKSRAFLHNSFLVHSNLIDTTFSSIDAEFKLNMNNKFNGRKKGYNKVFHDSRKKQLETVLLVVRNQTRSRVAFTITDVS
jgi:hypothetical protein